MRFCRILEWGKTAYMGSETYKPVEESYDKGSAFKHSMKMEIYAKLKFA